MLALRNIEVVDYERAGGPAWIDSRGGAGRPNISSAAVVDPDFKMWPVNGATVTQGYVTLRWRKSDSVVLRQVASCVEVEPGIVRCNPVRYTSVYVHDTTVPQACNVPFVARPYWANWKDSMVPIHVK